MCSKTKLFIFGRSLFFRSYLVISKGWRFEKLVSSIPLALTHSHKTECQCIVQQSNISHIIFIEFTPSQSFHNFKWRKMANFNILDCNFRIDKKNVIFLYSVCAFTLNLGESFRVHICGLSRCKSRDDEPSDEH